LGFSGLRKNSFRAESVTSAAKAVDENKPVIAAVNGCATQNQVQHRVFPQAVKPCPSQNPAEAKFFRSLPANLFVGGACLRAPNTGNCLHADLGAIHAVG
jgi:hypothetical protein